MATTDDIRRAVQTGWGRDPDEVHPHDTGMNSRTWQVRLADRRYVAKLVPVSERQHLIGGLAAATVVDRAGIPAGAPLPTPDGRTVVDLEDGALALLAHVAGRELVGDDPGEQAVIGSTLARAHLALDGVDLPDAERFHWIDPGAAHLDVAGWVRPAIAAALDAYDAIPPASLTWGPLHSDPAPEAFLQDGPTGECGLIDWDRALVGPRMYDVASAVMYVGGPGRADALLAAYVEVGGLARAEVARALAPMLRMRWAVQADYFARRIATDDRTGIADPAENAEGLEDARRELSR